MDKKPTVQKDKLKSSQLPISAFFGSSLKRSSDNSSISEALRNSLNDNRLLSSSTYDSENINKILYDDDPRKSNNNNKAYRTLPNENFGAPKKETGRSPIEENKYNKEKRDLKNNSEANFERRVYEKNERKVGGGGFLPSEASEESWEKFSYFTGPKGSSPIKRNDNNQWLTGWIECESG